VRPTDTSDVLFTSGTTGRPKGVVMTHGQTVRQFREWCEFAGLQAGDRYLIVNPFFHMFGYKAGWLASLLQGATIVPVPVFDVSTVLSLVETERITVLPGAPTIYRSILDHRALQAVRSPHPAGGDHRGGRHSGRADRGDARQAPVPLHPLPATG
jgi:acyl-CoA synthetase (AMP-forming)/AMP-acid ligase II